MVSHAWPQEKSGERDYYRPWVSMLNKFVTTFCTPFVKTPYFIPIHDTYFYHYNCIVQHKQSEVKLKLDVLGLQPPILDEGVAFCAAWEDIIIIGEARTMRTWMMKTLPSSIFNCS
jgi:hypothetical protein